MIELAIVFIISCYKTSGTWDLKENIDLASYKGNSHIDFNESDVGSKYTIY